MRVTLVISTFVFAATTYGCAPRELSLRETELLNQYERHKEASQARDREYSYYETLLERYLKEGREARTQDANRQFHELAVSGKLGKQESLIAARKMLDDPSYQQKLYSRSSSSYQSESLSARVDSAQATYKLRESEARALLPSLVAATVAYKGAWYRLPHADRPTDSRQVKEVLDYVGEEEAKAAVYDDAKKAEQAKEKKEAELHQKGKRQR